MTSLEVRRGVGLVREGLPRAEDERYRYMSVTLTHQYRSMRESSRKGLNRSPKDRVDGRDETRTESTTGIMWSGTPKLTSEAGQPFLPCPTTRSATGPRQFSSYPDCPGLSRRSSP